MQTSPVSRICRQYDEGNRIQTEKPKPLDIYRAARDTRIHKHIQNLAGGYNTVVGQLGKNLSAGEIALIHLLRLCIRKPRIIVLDEGNSELDPETEFISAEGF